MAVVGSVRSVRVAAGGLAGERRGRQAVRGNRRQGRATDQPPAAPTEAGTLGQTYVCVHVYAHTSVDTNHDNGCGFVWFTEDVDLVSRLWSLGMIQV